MAIIGHDKDIIPGINRDSLEKDITSRTGKRGPRAIRGDFHDRSQATVSTVEDIVCYKKITFAIKGYATGPRQTRSKGSLRRSVSVDGPAIVTGGAINRSE